MSAYWNVTSYKKDDSYITGRVRARGIYEFDMEKAVTFHTKRVVSFRGGVDSFEKIRVYEHLGDIGIYMKDLFFYFDADDLIEGSNIRKQEDEGGYCGMLIEPNSAFGVLQSLADSSANFTQNENQKNELLELLEILREAKLNNYLIHCYWC